MSVGDLLIGWLLLRQAKVARARLNGVAPAGPIAPADAAFYRGKIAAASFFARTVLPELTARAQAVADPGNTLMELPDDIF